MKRLIALLCFFTLITASTAWSHALWLNLNESFEHPPGHALTSIGWGHAVPMDDFLASENASILLEKYALIDPDGKVESLGVPVVKRGELSKTKSGLVTEAGDLGLRKISLTDKSKKGTHTVIVESKANYFTGYIDKKGKMKMSPKPMDQIKDAKKFTFSTRFKACAKSYMTVDTPSAPPASGFDLEITPITDMTNIKKGDLVEFEVTLNGEKLTCDMKGMNYLFAESNTYGSPDKFKLCSYIVDGKAQVRIPTTGQWMFNVLVKKNVTKDNSLKDLYGKCNSIYYGTTITANVKP